MMAILLLLVLLGASGSTAAEPEVRHPWFERGKHELEGSDACE